MKQTTEKEIKKRFSNKIINGGYGELQYLLQTRNPDYYTAGKYGFNADIYCINGIVITSGPRSFGKKINYEIIQKFEEQAKKLEQKDRDRHYELIKEFVAEALNLQI